MTAGASMEIVVINLERSVERLREFGECNRHVSPVRRFGAIEGKIIDRANLVDSLTIQEGLGYSDGALGCALSHLALWEEAASRNVALTICEDDAILHRNFVTLSEAQARSVPEWDLIMWGWNFDSILLFDLIPGVSPCLARFDQNGLRAGVAQFQEHPMPPATYRLRRAFGTVCYSISPEGARKFAERSLPLRRMTVDFPTINPAYPNDGIDKVMNALYPELNSYVCLPPIAATRNEHTRSTVLSS